jgi:hypothetical protein
MRMFLDLLTIVETSRVNLVSRLSSAAGSSSSSLRDLETTLSLEENVLEDFTCAAFAFLFFHCLPSC